MQHVGGSTALSLRTREVCSSSPLDTTTRRLAGDRGLGLAWDRRGMPVYPWCSQRRRRRRSMVGVATSLLTSHSCKGGHSNKEGTRPGQSGNRDETAASFPGLWRAQHSLQG